MRDGCAQDKEGGQRKREQRNAQDRQQGRQRACQRGEFKGVSRGEKAVRGQPTGSLVVGRG